MRLRAPGAAPGGSLRIAQRFSVWLERPDSHVPERRLKLAASSAGPSGLNPIQTWVPTLKRWATLKWAFGTGFNFFVVLAAFPAFAQFDPEEKIPALNPARGEIQPTFWEQHGVLVILGGLLLLVLIGVGLWLLLRPKAPVLTPPAQEARRTLEPLGRQPEDARILSVVSQTLRHYLAAAFNLPRGELTTAEFCTLLIQRQEIGAPLSVPLTNFLRQCDRRKFDPHAPDGPLGAVPQALQFIEQAETRRNLLAQAAAVRAKSK